MVLPRRHQFGIHLSTRTTIGILATPTFSRANIRYTLHALILRPSGGRRGGFRQVSSDSSGTRELSKSRQSQAVDGEWRWIRRDATERHDTFAQPRDNRRTAHARYTHFHATPSPRSRLTGPTFRSNWKQRKQAKAYRVDCVLFRLAYLILGNKSERQKASKTEAASAKEKRGLASERICQGVAVRFNGNGLCASPARWRFKSGAIRATLPSKRREIEHGRN